MRMLPALRRLVGTFAPALGVMLYASAVAASQQSVVPPGTRIRFELRDGSRHEGRVISLGREGLEAELPPTGATTRFLLRDIAQMEVVEGQHRPVGRDMLVGAGVGMAAGAGAGAIEFSPCTSTEFLGCAMRPNTRGEAVSMGARVGVILGLVAGGALGLIPRDRWQRIQTDGSVVRFNVRALPSSGTALALALEF